MTYQRTDFKVLQQEMLNSEVQSRLTNKNNKFSEEELLKSFPEPHLMDLLTSEKFRPLYEPNKYWYDNKHPVNRGIELLLDIPKNETVEIKVQVSFDLMADLKAYRGGTPYSPTEHSSPALYYTITDGVIYEKGEKKDATDKLVQSALDAYETGIPNPEVTLIVESHKNSVNVTISPGEVAEGRASISGVGWYTSIDAQPLDDLGNIILYCSTNNFAFNYADFVVKMRSNDIKLIDHLAFF